MKMNVRDFTYLIFAVVVSIVFFTNVFSPDITTTYWLLLTGLIILFIWILIKSVTEKAILLVCTLVMLSGLILVKLENLIAIVLGMVLFCVGLFFFVFRRVR